MLATKMTLSGEVQVAFDACRRIPELSTRDVESGLRGAANNIRVYASDWRCFIAWCALHRLDSLSAPVKALASFLTEQAGFDSPTANSPAGRRASAWRIRGLACRQLSAGPCVVWLSQRVRWSWLNAPSSSRDKPVAVVGPVELSK